MSVRDDYNGYMRSYMLRRHKKRRKLAIKLLGGVCVVCGTSRSLEFDHKDRTTKKFTIAKYIVSIAENRLITELNKCQLLCSTCHKKKSIEEQGMTSHKGKHGTNFSYRYCGPPPCALCKSAHTAYNKKYKTSYSKSL